MKTTIELAREARAMIYNSPSDPKKLIDIMFTPETIKAFEALVRADEREIDAKLIETHVPTTTPTWVSYAAAIRARGNT